MNLVGDKYLIFHHCDRHNMCFFEFIDEGSRKSFFPFVILNCNHDLNQAWIYEFWTRREEQRRNSSDERKFVTFCWLFATLCNSLHQIPIINWDMFVNFFQTSSNCWISDWFQCRWCWWLQSGFWLMSSDINSAHFTVSNFNYFTFLFPFFIDYSNDVLRVDSPIKVKSVDKNVEMVLRSAW